MDIRGLRMDEISKILVPYIEKYFSDAKLKLNDCIFAESYSFEFEEIKHIFPEIYRSKFENTDKFNGASGIIAVDSKEYNVFLISNEDYTTALVLAIQETDTDSIVIIKDFLESERSE